MDNAWNEIKLCDCERNCQCRCWISTDGKYMKKGTYIYGNWVETIYRLNKGASYKGNTPT